MHFKSRNNNPVRIIASQLSFLYQLSMSFCYGHGLFNISPPILTALTSLFLKLEIKDFLPYTTFGAPVER